MINDCNIIIHWDIVKCQQEELMQHMLTNLICFDECFHRHRAIKFESELCNCLYNQQSQQHLLSVFCSEFIFSEAPYALFCVNLSSKSFAIFVNTVATES